MIMNNRERNKGKGKKKVYNVVGGEPVGSGINQNKKENDSPSTHNKAPFEL